MDLHPKKSPFSTTNPESYLNIYLIAPRGKMGAALHQEIDRRNKEKKRFTLVEAPSEADVVIDFSSPSGTETSLLLEKPLVCGTTGLNTSIMKKIEIHAQKYPTLYSPNFSLGIYYLSKICLDLKNTLPFFSAEIEEIHHIHKKDAPSGTALLLGKLLDIPKEKICSLRKEEIAGIHTVKFFFGEELLSLTHESGSRAPFAFGALEAAKFLFGKKPKFYTLSDIFD